MATEDWADFKEVREMRKMIRAVAAVMLVCSLAGCGNNVSEPNDPVETEPVQTEESPQPPSQSETGDTTADADETDTAGSGVLILYFSRTGDPFSTHEGSGLSGFDQKLASACPDSTVAEGLAIRGNDAQNDQDGVRASVDDWISGLGYSE